jgi:hypothetical protein
METVTKTKSPNMRSVMSDILLDISWAQLSTKYFGKSRSWLHRKMDGINSHGEADEFSSGEKKQLKGALCDLSERIRQAAEKI